MRAFLFKAILILLVLAFFLGLATAGSAALGFLRPGQPLFAVQHAAERQRAGLIRDARQLALYELMIAARRVSDLHTLAGTPAESAGLAMLDQSLDRVSLAVSQASAADAPELTARLEQLLRESDTALAVLSVTPLEDPARYESVQVKVRTLLGMLAGSPDPAGSMDQLAQSLISRLNSEQVAAAPTLLPTQSSQNMAAIPFPPDSPAARHEFYPLVGAHSQIGCADCHQGEQYAGTPTECSACHQEDRPVNHFAGECTACHSALSWLDIQFDHSLVDASNCLGCHSQDLPANHYGGQCSACHNTSSWFNVNFDHTGRSDCKACHSGDAPAKHYSGQCSRCHNTNNWANVNFDHSGQSDCKACHSGDAPARHFSGQCSRCHNTRNWANANFDHSGQSDCKACHSSDAPAKHYSGQCSQCHNTNNWNAKFNHSGQKKCRSCHNEDAPDRHFKGQCSQCHSTGSWKFEHRKGTNCLACHAKDEPDDEDDHPRGQQCSECHNTKDWDD